MSNDKYEALSRGRGRCAYCFQEVNNVAFHESRCLQSGMAQMKEDSMSASDVKAPPNSAASDSLSQEIGEILHRCGLLERNALQDSRDILRLLAIVEELQKELEICNEGLLTQEKRLSVADGDLARLQVKNEELQEELKDWKLVAIADNKRCLNLEERLAVNDGILRVAEVLICNDICADPNCGCIAGNLIQEIRAALALGTPVIKDDALKSKEV